jgi:alpha-D-ribose 1-methylphosphonate 5-triphosphate diphosphatase
MQITGGTVLLGADGLQRADLVLRNGLIASGRGEGARFDARELLVLPGIVDLHGDAFERQLQPRPGVEFPADLALRDTEIQLLANGITTAFHGVTLSWEPGLRGLATWRALLDALDAGRWTCDMRVHLRWEAYNLDALEVCLADIAAGRVHLLAFNDHTPAILRKLDDPVEGAKYSNRAGMDMGAFRGLAEGVAGRGDAVPGSNSRAADG